MLTGVRRAVYIGPGYVIEDVGPGSMIEDIGPGYVIEDVRPGYERFTQCALPLRPRDPSNLTRRRVPCVRHAIACRCRCRHQ